MNWACYGGSQLYAHENYRWYVTTPGYPLDWEFGMVPL